MKKFVALAVLPALSLAASPAFADATPPNFTALTGAIDVSTTVAAILAVGAVVVGVSLAVLGVRKVIGMVRGA